jgi:hypothetical protein
MPTLPLSFEDLQIAASHREDPGMTSYVRGTNEPPLLETTIGQALDCAARLWTAPEAVVCPAQRARLSWRDFSHSRRRSCYRLLGRGVFSLVTASESGRLIALNGQLPDSLLPRQA